MKYSIMISKSFFNGKYAMHPTYNRIETTPQWISSNPS